MKRRIQQLRAKAIKMVKGKDEKKTTKKSGKSQSKPIGAYINGKIVSKGKKELRWDSMTKAANALKTSRVGIKKAIEQKTPIDTLGGAILKYIN